MSAKHISREERLSFVAWKIAPLVRAERVEETDSWTHIVYECGHSGDHAWHFHHKVGETYRCGECGRAKALLLPEFAAKATGQ